MERITLKQLQSKIDYLNDITKHEKKPWKVINGKNVANIGTFYLDSAYGRYDVCQIVNDGGGVSSLFNGHHSKRETYDKLNYFIRGINFKGEI